MVYRGRSIKHFDKGIANKRGINNWKLFILGGFSMPYVEVEKGIQYYYEDIGQGQPIVFVHGWGMSRKVWERQVVDLSDKFRVITIDWRGCGKSDKPAHGYEISKLADDIN